MPEEALRAKQLAERRTAAIRNRTAHMKMMNQNQVQQRRPMNRKQVQQRRPMRKVGH